MQKITPTAFESLNFAVQERMALMKQKWIVECGNFSLFIGGATQDNQMSRAIKDAVLRELDKRIATEDSIISKFNIQITE